MPTLSPTREQRTEAAAEAFEAWKPSALDFNVVDLGAGVYAVTDVFPMVPTLAHENQRALKKLGFTAADLLEGLDETKEEIAQQRRK